MYEVSVITTSKNYGKYLETCIQSVRRQTHRLVSRVNHIVVDGGSIDNTLMILNQYEDYIKYIVEPEEGQTAALNHAMQIVDDEYPDTTHIGWVNADDFYRHYWLEAMMDILRKEPEDVALVCSDIVLYDGVTEDRTTWGLQRYFDKAFFGRHGNTVSQPSVLIRLSKFKELKDKYGFYFNPAFDYCQDLELWYRFLDSGCRIRHLPKLTAYLRLHEAQMSNTARPQQSKERDIVIKKMCEDTGTPLPLWYGKW